MQMNFFKRLIVLRVYYTIMKWCLTTSLVLPLVLLVCYSSIDVRHANLIANATYRLNSGCRIVVPITCHGICLIGVRTGGFICGEECKLLLLESKTLRKSVWA